MSKIKQLNLLSKDSDEYDNLYTELIESLENYCYDNISSDVNDLNLVADLLKDMSERMMQTYNNI